MLSVPIPVPMTDIGMPLYVPVNVRYSLFEISRSTVSNSLDTRMALAGSPTIKMFWARSPFLSLSDKGVYQ